MSVQDAATDPLLAAFLTQVMSAAATQDLTQDLRAKTRNLSIVFLIIAVLFVCLRFMARFKQGAKYALDDWLIVLSLFFLAANFTCNIFLIKNGLGLHSGALTLDQAMNIGKILLLNKPLYVTNLTITKISLLLMYFRIFPVRSVKLGGYILGGFCIALNVTLIILAELECHPFKKSWQPWVEGHCIDIKATQLVIALPNILTDIGILCLPLPLIWGLQTKIFQKILLSVVFLIGSFVVFTSIYRFTVYLNYDPNDLPYSLAIGCAWNVIEISSGIVSACAPALGPLVRMVLDRLGSSLWSSTANTKGQSTKMKSLQTIGGGGTSGNHHRGRKSRDFEELATTAEDSEFEYRPKQGPVVSVAVAGGRSEGGSERSHGNEDEIPLKTMRGIRQQRDVEWKEEWVGDDHGGETKENSVL